jgi:hypothetical protein
MVVSMLAASMAGICVEGCLQLFMAIISIMAPKIAGSNFLVENVFIGILLLADEMERQNYEKTYIKTTL